MYIWLYMCRILPLIRMRVEDDYFLTVCERKREKEIYKIMWNNDFYIQIDLNYRAVKEDREKYKV